MTFPLSLVPLDGEEVGDYGLARVRDVAFDAVHRLWRRRQAEGMTQKHLAAKVGRDPATISRNLRAPGNWTFRTFGELIEALNGNVRIIIDAAEDSSPNPSNYDAYDDHDLGESVVSTPQSLHFSPTRGLSDDKKPTGTVTSLLRVEWTHG